MMNRQTDLELKASSNEKAMDVDVPGAADVLCGRGKMCFHHEGNDSFRMLIAEHVDTYKMAPTKKLKMQVVACVVDIVIARGGRFMIQNVDGSWLDGGRKQGKKKTGHAMRDALRGRVKCITQMRENNALALQNFNDDSSHSSSSLHSSEEFDLDSCDWLNEMESMNPSNFEPSKDWMHSKVDNEIANDLLSFFIAEELRKPDECRS